MTFIDYSRRGAAAISARCPIPAASLSHTEHARAVLKPNLCTQLPPPHVILYTAACPAELNKRKSEEEETVQRASQTPAARLSDASLML